MKKINKVLRADHREIYSLLQELSEAKSYQVKKYLFHKIKNEVVSHMECEEAYIYSNLKECSVKATSDKEHHEIRELLQKLILFHFDTEKWWKTFEVLKVVVKNHCDKEERELFPELTNDFSPFDLQMMANNLLKVRHPLLSSY